MDRYSIPCRRNDVVEATVDGDHVLMSGRDYSYFGLTGTGSAVWGRIDGLHSIADIADGLFVEYDADPEMILEQVTEFVDAMVTAGLVDIVS